MGLFRQLYNVKVLFTYCCSYVIKWSSYWDFSFGLCSQSGSNLSIMIVILFFIIFPTMMIYIQVCQICHQWCRPLWRISPAVLSLLLMLRPQLLWISNPPPIIGIINDDSSSPISHTQTCIILFDLTPNYLNNSVLQKLSLSLGLLCLHFKFCYQLPLNLADYYLAENKHGNANRPFCTRSQEAS